MSSTKKYPFLDLGAVNEPLRGAIEEAALRVIRSGRYIGGEEVARFEQALCTCADAPLAVGVSNGLDAMRLIFKAYMLQGRLREGDEVIVPANTYIASVLAVTDCGLTPVLVDPDPDTMNLTGRGVAQAITPRTRAVLTVHLYGRLAYDDEMLRAVRSHDLLLVEDAAQAIGCRSDVCGVDGHGHRVGSLGHAAAFSFYPTKNIGALGDAGAVTTSDPELAAAVRALANYGSDRRYHNIYCGYNCRLDTLQAAILTEKLKHLDDITARRIELAEVYDSNITNPLVEKPMLPANPLSNVWHQYPVRVGERDRFRTYLLERGVETDVNYPTPPHLQPCYAEYAGLELPVTRRICDTVVCLPITSKTSPDDGRAIARIINDFR